MVQACDGERTKRRELSEESDEEGDTREEEQRTAEIRVEVCVSEGHANHRSENGRTGRQGNMDGWLSTARTSPDDKRLQGEMIRKQRYLNKPPLETILRHVFPEVGPISQFSIDNMMALYGVA